MIIDVELSKGDYWDLILENGDLKGAASFNTAIAYSLLGERRASSSEVPISERRRGWIGNEGEAFENGSKIWIYEQERVTRSLLGAISSAAYDSLFWLVDLGYLKQIEAKAVYTNLIVGLEITLYRFNSPTEKLYFSLWENTGVN